MLFTRHYHEEHPSTGGFTGAISDGQARRAEALVRAAGQEFTCPPFPDTQHSVHEDDPQPQAKTVLKRASGLG